MKFICIVLEDNRISETGFENLQKSTQHKVQRFRAVEPSEVSSHMNELKLSWNYPFVGSVYDKELGLMKTAYPTRVPEKRIACSLSHYLLWRQCAEVDETFVILEHDAIFRQDIDFELPDEYDVLGLNDPIMATRKDRVFDGIVQQSKDQFLPVPVIDNMKVPQGLAGNSAYMINKRAASNLLTLVDRHGLWPNDAIMCQQLLPRMGVSKTYYTGTQRLPSTTSL